MANANFLFEFFSNYKRIGAIAPSSHSLASKMVEEAYVGEADTIAEIGAGTGAITKVILAKMRQQARLFVFEPHINFYNVLQTTMTDPRITLLSETAQSMKEALKKI